MFDPAFLEVMTYRPKLLPKTGDAQYGQRTYGPAVEMRAYWQEGGETAEASGGQSSAKKGTLWIAPAAYWDAPFGREPDTDDGLELPNGSRVTIGKVTVHRDEDGVVGTEMEYS